MFLQELHSTTGSALTWNPPADYKLFDLHWTAAAAGVGILVHKSFLQFFDEITSDELECIVPGRVGRLRLKGLPGLFGLIFGVPNDRR